jgi:hypothetical protein
MRRLALLSLSTSISLFLLASVAALSSTGCREKEKEIVHEPAKSADAPPKLLLRSYTVPAGQGQQAKSILQSLFYGVKDKVAARATLSPDGQLVVVAPETIHKGVAELVARMKEGKPQGAPPSVEMTYWLVVGRPAPKTRVDETIGAIKPALEAVASAQGPMEFRLLERLKVSSLSDSHGRGSGRHATIRQTVSVTGKRAIADLDITLPHDKRSSHLETRVAIDPAKLLVLGEAGIEPPAGFWPITGGGGKRGDSTLYYVVRMNIKG